jgi:hypothetical protein
VCGRFQRRSDKQKVAQVFGVQAGLEEADFAPGADLRPQSMQPVIFQNESGERQIEMMRWGFKLPDRLLFNALLRHQPGKLLEGCVSDRTCNCTGRCDFRVEENARR